jgi:PKD domain
LQAAAAGPSRSQPSRNQAGRASGLGAALALAKLGEQLPGRVRFLGTPAEEAGNGKELMARAGAFQDIAAAVVMHPSDYNRVNAKVLACTFLEVTYIGNAPDGSMVAEGTCMLGANYGQQCDNYGRQETVYFETPAPGTYILEVYKGTTDSNNGQFSYEVSRGPVVAGLPPANLPPLADAGSDQTINVASGQSASVTLHGENSSDPDGSINSWAWKETGATIASTPTPMVSLAAGTHTITLTVTDNMGATATDTVVITVKSCNPRKRNCPSV